MQELADSGVHTAGQQSAVTPMPDHRQVVKKTLIFCAAAFGFCFAMIPLYSIYCEVTGANGKTGRMNPSAITVVDRSRLVQIEFLTAVNSGLSWHFKPELSKLDVHPGELTTAYFVATNDSNEAIVGNAVPSVAPNEASIYFNKTECFCFTEQMLQPGESRRMPVRFIVDSAMPKNITVLTLAYTFYRNETATQSYKSGKRS